MQLRRRRYKTAILLAGRADPLGDATDPDARTASCVLAEAPPPSLKAA